MKLGGFERNRMQNDGMQLTVKRRRLIRDGKRVTNMTRSMKEVLDSGNAAVKLAVTVMEDDISSA